MFINEKYIKNLLLEAKNPSIEKIEEILNKARDLKVLTHQDVAILLSIEDEVQLEKMFNIAGEIKQKIYGNRVVIFAPLYVSDYCVNNCIYCGYRRDNKFDRKKLSISEIQEEVKILEKMGHKRLALEAGEDGNNCDIDYIVDSIHAVYDTKLDHGEIRRINVNIAATTVEDYKKLKATDIGTYILFQETYHKPTFELVHPESTKGDYGYHLSAFDRAMEAGIEDVGAGVLFGLYDAAFEVLGLLLHNEHLEKECGVGFHTVSVPRMKKAKGMELSQFPYIPDDKTFKKMVAIIRLMLPFTGILLSTRESAEMRTELLRHGVSQISAGSSVGVGAYKQAKCHAEADDKSDAKSDAESEEVNQFEVSDERSPIEILKGLIADGFIPSYCTACYRQGRTGDRFMQLAKSGNIHFVCQPNALMTLFEYILDYGDKELFDIGNVFILQEIQKITNLQVKELTLNNLERMKNGERDLYI